MPFAVPPLQAANRETEEADVLSEDALASSIRVPEVARTTHRLATRGRMAAGALRKLRKRVVFHGAARAWVDEDRQERRPNLIQRPADEVRRRWQPGERSHRRVDLRTQAISQ